MKVKMMTGYGTDARTFIGIANPGDPLNHGSLNGVDMYDIDNHQFVTKVYTETYLVLDQPPTDMFGLCTKGGVFSADCAKICGGTGDKATECLNSRDIWCSDEGGLDTITDNCVDAMVGRTKNYNLAREKACALQLSKESIADVDITAFLVKYPHCSCFFGDKLYEEFKASVAKKNPDYADIVNKFADGRCLFPQCVSSYTKDQPYSFSCPSVQICIETVDVTIGGDVKGDVNVKQASTCTINTDSGKAEEKKNITPPPLNPPPPPPPADGDDSATKANIKLIAGFAIGIGFLFLILLVLLLTKKK